MTELWLKFQDEDGTAKRVLVEQEKFIVGRHSENDLSISNEKLSREHLKIDRFDNIFVVSDCGSSNGTTLNGENLTEPATLKNEDRLNLGGDLEMEVELISDDPNANPNGSGTGNAVENNDEIAAASMTSPSISATSNESSISTSIFWLAPLFGLFVLLFAGGLLFVLSGKKEKDVGKTDDGFTYSTNRTSTKDKTPENDETPTPKPTSSPQNSTNNLSTGPTPEDTNSQPTPKVSSEADKIGQNASSFMRRIAFNDPKPFLTSEQLEFVNSKISQFKGSAALAENLKAVKKNAAQFESLAMSKNLKPQFLAIAALTKIGNTRGDPLAAAQAMLPVLSDLKGTLDNKLADDNLLIIAGYARNQTGKNTPLQNVIEGLSKSSQTENVTPREIRTIWFLKKKDKISDAEFNFALQFLAIGAISQSPKDFNVISEAVAF
ncbi:MAG: FHA domain-containing protein [Pyrinomonadaceae bacterium]